MALLALRRHAMAAAFDQTARGNGVGNPARSRWPWQARLVDCYDLVKDRRHHSVASWRFKRKCRRTFDASTLVQGVAQQHSSSVQASLRGFLGNVETFSGLGRAHAFDL